MFLDMREHEQIPGTSVPLLPLLYTFLSLTQNNIFRNRTQLRREMNAPVDPFPQPVRLSGNRIAWDGEAVRAWVKRRMDKGPRVPKPKPPRKNLPQETGQQH